MTPQHPDFFKCIFEKKQGNLALPERRLLTRILRFLFKSNPAVMRRQIAYHAQQMKTQIRPK
jgi:hypothetical protein